jgi:hypothetical protein
MVRVEQRHGLGNPATKGDNMQGEDLKIGEVVHVNQAVPMSIFKKGDIVTVKAVSIDDGNVCVWCISHDAAGRRAQFMPGYALSRETVAA